MLWLFSKVVVGQVQAANRVAKMLAPHYIEDPVKTDTHESREQSQIPNGPNNASDCSEKH